MNLDKYLSLDEEHTLPPDEAQTFNADLSCRSLSEIPEEHRSRVADYIVTALNLRSVEPQLIPSMDKLLQGLRQDS